jgi:hypothetical protein
MISQQAFKDMKMGLDNFENVNKIWADGGGLVGQGRPEAEF